MICSSNNHGLKYREAKEFGDMLPQIYTVSYMQPHMTGILGGGFVPLTNHWGNFSPLCPHVYGNDGHVEIVIA